MLKGTPSEYVVKSVSSEPTQSWNVRVNTVRDDVYIVAICRHHVGDVSSRHPHLVFHRERTPVVNSARSTCNLFVGCSSGVEWLYAVLFSSLRLPRNQECSDFYSAVNLSCFVLYSIFRNYWKTTPLALFTLCLQISLPLCCSFFTAVEGSSVSSAILKTSKQEVTYTSLRRQTFIQYFIIFPLLSIWVPHHHFNRSSSCYILFLMLSFWSLWRYIRWKQWFLEILFVLGVQHWIVGKGLVSTNVLFRTHFLPF